MSQPGCGRLARLAATLRANDLNPIELVFSKLKWLTRSASERTVKGSGICSADYSTTSNPMSADGTSHTAAMPLHLDEKETRAAPLRTTPPWSLGRPIRTRWHACWCKPELPPPTDLRHHDPLLTFQGGCRLKERHFVPMRGSAGTIAAGCFSGIGAAMTSKRWQAIFGLP